jgi:hypothetical protein
MDPAWAGVVGTAVGVIAGGLFSLLAPVINWQTERRRIDLEHTKKKELLAEELKAELAKADADHQRRMNELEIEREQASKEVRRGRTREWREGLEEAGHAMRDDDFNAREAGEAGTSYLREFSFVGKTWFETLRPELKLSVQTMYMVEEAPNLTHLELLHEEINRIEREWGLI